MLLRSKGAIFGGVKTNPAWKTPSRFFAPVFKFDLDTGAILLYVGQGETNITHIVNAHVMGT